VKYLAELNETVDYLVEGEGAAKKHYIQGLFLEFDSFNRNKRIYRSEMLDPNVQNYIKEKIDDKRAWGELDHPDGPTINLKNASHRIMEMHKEGSNWHGKALITNTPLGNTVKGLLESGGNLGVSSRGMGSLKSIQESTGGLEVQKDYKILTAADIVSDPSAHGALVKGIMENVEWFYDETTDSFLAETSQNLKNQVKKMTLREIEDTKTAMFAAFLNTLKIRNK
jgi:hypothetical protein